MLAAFGNGSATGSFANENVLDEEADFPEAPEGGPNEFGTAGSDWGFCWVEVEEEDTVGVGVAKDTFGDVGVLGRLKDGGLRAPAADWGVNENVGGGLFSLSAGVSSAGFVIDIRGTAASAHAFSFSLFSFSFLSFSSRSFSSLSLSFFLLASRIFLIASASNSCFSHFENIRYAPRGLLFVLSANPGVEEAIEGTPLNTDATREVEATRRLGGAWGC